MFPLSVTWPRAADPLPLSDQEFRTHGGICPTVGRSVTAQGKAPHGTVYPVELGAPAPRAAFPSDQISAWILPRTPAQADPLLHLTKGETGAVIDWCR